MTKYKGDQLEGFFYGEFVLVSLNNLIITHIFVRTHGFQVPLSIMDTLRSFGKEPVLNCLMYLVIGRDASN